MSAQESQIEAPAWAQKGLDEATRLSDLLLAEGFGGAKRWDDGDGNLWHLSVSTEYLNVSSWNRDAVMPGMAEVTAEAVASIENGGDTYTWKRTTWPTVAGWRIVGWAS